MTDENVIEMQGICKKYKMGDSTVHALKEIDLIVPAGDFVSLVGPSGSGKSTLLNMIGCIDVPDCGSINILGKDTSKLTDSQLTRIRLESIGFIFQSFYLIPALNAIENVELTMKEIGLSRSERRKKAEGLLESMNLLDRKTHYPSQMSGGEQQRVAIARALANGPRIILADEPTGEVDSKTSQMIVDLLKELNSERGVTIIMVTHDLAIGKEAKRMVTLKDGGITDDKKIR